MAMSLHDLGAGRARRQEGGVSAPPFAVDAKPYQQPAGAYNYNPLTGGPIGELTV